MEAGRRFMNNFSPDMKPSPWGTLKQAPRSVIEASG